MNRKRDGRLFNDLEISVIVGKGGMEGGMLEEMKRVARERRYFKVKLLRSSPVSLEEVGRRLHDEGIADLLSRRGRVGLFKSKMFHPPGTY